MSASQQKPASLRKRLAKAILGVSAGAAIYGASNIFLVFMLMQFRGLETVGNYGLAAAIAGPIYVLFFMNFARLLGTDIEHRFRFSDYVGVFLLAHVVAALVMMGAALIVAPDILLTCAALALVRTKENVFRLFHGATQREDRPILMGASLTLHGLLNCATYAVAIIAGAPLWLVLVAAAVNGLILTALFDRPRLLPAGNALLLPMVTRPQAAALMREGIPSGLRRGLNNLAQNIPRFAVEFVLGREALGLMTVFLQIIAMLQLITRACQNALLGYWSRAYKAHPKFLVIVPKFMALGAIPALIYLALAVGAPGLLDFGTAEGTAQSLHLSVATVSLLLVVQATMSTMCLIMRILVAEAAITLVGVLVAAAVAVPLTRAFGLEGAFYALILNAIVTICLQFFIALRHERHPNRHIDPPDPTT